MRTKTFIFCIVALFIVGCSASGSGNKGKGNGADGMSENDLDTKLEDRFGEGSIPLAEAAGMFRDVRFGYDSAEVDDMARQDIEHNVDLLQKYPELQLILEGHTDDRGTAEYNLALGADRSLAVNHVMQSLGISPDRVRTISYGEEVPLVSGENEGAWSQNRRVHFAAHTGNKG